MDNNKDEIEINLLDLGKKLWNNKKFIIKCSIIGAAVGIVIAFSIPKKYTTTVILTTGPGESAKGGMGALASMAGINLGGAIVDELLSPDIYPDILKSTPFTSNLLETKIVNAELEIETSLYLYLKDNQKETWWSYIFGAPSKIISYFITPKNQQQTSCKYYTSRERVKITKKLIDSYSINTDKKTGITTLKTSFQDPTISALVADTLTSYLQKYIIAERTKKAKADLDNTIRLYSQAQVEYYKNQEKLAIFIDNNRDITSARHAINQEKLQNETNLTYSVYTQMAQQVQMKEIRVQNETPVFTIIQPPLAPIDASSPNKLAILIFFSFMTGTIASIYHLRYDIAKILK